MKFYELVLGLLATWRVTHLLNAEDGPAAILVRVRRWAGDSVWGSLLDCFYCLSLWVAAPVALILDRRWKERLLLWPAISGGAILLQRFSSKSEAPVLPIYSEDQEREGREDPNVLRK